MVIEAVLFDLDDTLFEQADWLRGAWGTVADAAPDGIDQTAFRAALESIASEGSARGGIIDRALRSLGVVVDPAPLVDAFRQHESGPLEPFRGVRAGLRALRAEVPVGLVTDGYVPIQRDKLAALGLSDAFDVVVFSDELGRQHRKPHPMPFRRALDSLGVAAANAVMVGDRPEKDVDGAVAIGMRACRVRTGEYRDLPNGEPPWRSFDGVGAAIGALLHEVRSADLSKV